MPRIAETDQSNRSSAASKQPATAEPLVFVENSDPSDTYTYGLSEVIFRGRTQYQDVVIADTRNYGLALMLDGAIQSAEEDEHLYHEMLVQPALLCHPDPRDVLIIGGGEGATLREVLVHPVRSATMVDLDQQVVELCRRYLPTWHRGAFDDPRVKLRFVDGRSFVESDSGIYDVAIIDVVDMLDNGPAQKLYTLQFYETLKKRLRSDALVVVQGLEFSFMDDKPHAALRRTLQQVFSEVHSYRVQIPSFLSAWGFLIASDWFDPEELDAAAIDGAIERRLGSDYLQHATGEFIQASFVLCALTRRRLAEAGPILEDNVAFSIPPETDSGANVPPLRFPLKGRR